MILDKFIADFLYKKLKNFVMNFQRGLQPFKLKRSTLVRLNGFPNLMKRVSILSDVSSSGFC